jgi:long-chain acyl-CoA synthetase
MNFHDDIDAYGVAPAIIAENGEQTSYTGLLEVADAIGQLLPSRSLVFCLCDSNLESLAAYVGLLRARSVPLLLNKDIHADAFSKLLHDYRPAYLWLPQDSVTSSMPGRPVHHFGAYVLLKTDFVQDYPLHPDLALLMTTSGSTGSPLLVRQSYRNLHSNAAAIVQYLGITRQDRPITSLPMSYTYGLSIINSHLLKGCTILLNCKTLMDRSFWEMLKTHGATSFGGVPYVYEMLHRLRFERMSLPSLRYLTQAGGRLSPALSRHFADLCQEKGIRYITMYGQTEATARMAYLPSEYASSKAGSIGIAIPGGEFWLEDEAGRPITDHDTTGELVYRGENVAMGYARSREDLGKGDENGGVLRTGDLACRDTDGYYYITGRKKRFLKLFGNRINLAELEQLAGEVGYPCVCAGEDDHVRIYTTDREHHAEIKRHVVERTGLHASGFEVLYIERIPRNAAGKILYSALR